MTGNNKTYINLDIVYSFISLDIVTECISDCNDTNKRNNCRKIYQYP